MTAPRIALAVALAAAVGCANETAPKAKPPAVTPSVQAPTVTDAVAAERAKLSPEDKALVDAQDVCVVAGEKLGSMGAPIKLMVKDTPVFICCKSCEKKALADPDATLKKLDELKAKTKAEKN